jgi:small-conductance mechanosensitive channel
VVINYSAEGRHEGVIFHTTVTIGYKAPWRQVHELLLSAARETEDVLRTPQPFVLQTALNDFYATYELNAYTAKPMNMQYIYSYLHQNIQDKFYEAGIEINSPHYLSLRDGNQTTIPETYATKDSKCPTFGFEKINAAEAPKGKQF